MFDLLAQTLPSVTVPNAGTAQAPQSVGSGTIATTMAPDSSGNKPAPPDSFMFIRQVGPIILMVVVFLLLFNRSKKKESASREDMLSKMKKGDEVQTIGGILGKVMEAREDKVLLKVDENSNTKIWFSRTAIARVVGEVEETK
jgi:preprotein translocase subunit YajC